MDIRTLRYFVNLLAIAGALGYLVYKVVYPASHEAEVENPEIEVIPRSAEQAAKFEQIAADAIWLEDHLNRFGELEIDLTETDRVYTAEKYFSTDSFIPAFSRASWRTGQLEIDIIISDETDLVFLRKLKSQLNRKYMNYTIFRAKPEGSGWKSGYALSEEPSGVTADDPEIIEITLTADDRIDYNGISYYPAKFLNVLDKQSKENTIRLVVVVTSETSDEFLSQASQRFFNKGYDYELDFQ